MNVGIVGFLKHKALILLRNIANVVSGGPTIDFKRKFFRDVLRMASVARGLLATFCFQSSMPFAGWSQVRSATFPLKIRYKKIFRLLSERRCHHLVSIFSGVVRQKVPMRGIALVCLIGMAFLPTAKAADRAPTYHLPTDFRGEVDQEGARAAVRRGDAAPFADILKKVRPHILGEIVGQKLEQHLGVWVYEFRVIAPDGHMNYVHFHARSGEAFTVKPLP